MSERGGSGGRGPLLILGAAQFVMVVDSTVMNVSLTRVVADLHTTIVGMQTAITMFTLVMAAFMLTGGKLGARWGARRAFAIGLVVYGIGSLLTALSPNLGVLLIGWSLLEGLGAVLVIPAIIALIGSTFSGAPRAAAFGLIGGVSGAAAAAGPLIGGWVTQVATWRYVFATETVVCVLILPFLRILEETKAEKARLDFLGVGLSAAGLGVAVYGILRSSVWGLLRPKDAAPFTLLGLSPALWCIVAGVALFVLFALWERRLVAAGRDPLLDVPLLVAEQQRGGLGTLACLQFLIAGIFFVLPLYLQTMLGLDSLDTGIRIVPLSATLFVAALLGARLAARFSPRRVCQSGLLIALAGVAVLGVAIDPELNGPLFAAALAVFGAGAGLVMSQIGAINLAGIPVEKGGEVGGLQGTAQNLGFSLGTAMVGALLLSALSAGFVRFSAQQPELSAGLQPAIRQAAETGTDFVPASQVEKAAASQTNEQQAALVVDSYERAQLTSLKIACALIGLVALGGLWFARKVPQTVVETAAQEVPATTG